LIDLKTGSAVCELLVLVTLLTDRQTDRYGRITFSAEVKGTIIKQVKLSEI